MAGPERTVREEERPAPAPANLPGAPRGAAAERLAALPLPVLVAGMAALWVSAPSAALAAPGLLRGLDLVFATLVSFLAAFLAVRGFLARGEPGLLLLACGAEVWGTGALLATIAGWNHPNVVVTVHDGCALLSAASHAAGALLARGPRRTVRAVDAAATLALGAGVLVPALLAGAALEGLTPAFFAEGTGGTLSRDLVLGAAAVLFAAAAGMRAVGRGPPTRFTRFYALALGLVAAGLAGSLAQPGFGGLLGWAARATQYLGGAYMLVAAVASVRETRGWARSLEAGLADVESRLERREARFRAFFENLREGVALYEPVRGPGGEVVDWIVREANALYAAGVGAPLARLVGARVGEVLGPETLAEWSREWRAVLEGGEPLAYERVVAGRSYAITCFRMDADTVAATAFDVTERRRAEQAVRDSERLYRAIGESIDYGVWVCAPDGRNVYASESFLRLVGITQQECSDFGWGVVLHPDDAERTIAAWKECVRTGGTWDIEHRFRGVDGKWHPILARGVPVRNEAGEITCWAGINLDIARLKDAEQRLRESDRRKSEFLAVLSHELRNPLAPIRTAVQVLAVAPEGSAEASRAREVIERQVDHLARLVDDLLDVTRISRGKVRLARRRVDLRDAVTRTCDDHRALLARRGIALQVTAGERAYADADPTRLAQVIGNLLQNAAKFTPEGGTVRVRLGTAAGRAELRVEDDGVGMAPDLLARVFEPFTQAEDGLARTQGGLGLGLALVKGLVELHGGSVTARSEGEGHGSTFLVSLPLAAPAAGEAAAPAAPPAAPGLDVLVVEDGEDAARTLADLLEISGHRVRIARDGRSGVELARAAPPDLVLCDIGLPDLDGFAVARALRADPALRRTRLVALSGYALPDDRARAAEAGFDAHLAKPAPLAELERILADVARARAGAPA